MGTTEDIAGEYLRAADADWHAAILRMASTLAKVRNRVEDSLPNKGMDGQQLALLWKDLHPNHQVKKSDDTN